MTIEIVHADSLTWIADKDPRDWALLLIDPPYGQDHTTGTIARAKFGGVKIAGDLDTSTRDQIMSWWGPGPAAVFGSLKIPAYGDPCGVLVWDKGGQSGGGDLGFPWWQCLETISLYGKWSRGSDGKASPVIAVPPARFSDGFKDHPHQKPAVLLQAILDKAPPGPVLDLTAGSGSTAVACARLGRPCTVVEIDERWIPTIHRRVATEGAQMPLFA